MQYINGQQMNAEHPDTFDWPDLERQADEVKIGCYVKVGIVVPDAGKEFPSAERLWVKVICFSRMYDRSYPDGVCTFIAGTLANTPMFIDGKDFGDFIQFQPINILDIQPRDTADDDLKPGVG